jgi:hypothetical protein
MIRSADDRNSVLKAISPLLAAYGGMEEGDAAMELVPIQKRLFLDGRDQQTA